MKTSVYFLVCLMVGWSQAFHCSNVRCEAGKKCRLVYASGEVSAVCIDSNKLPKRNRCGSSGFPLLYEQVKPNGKIRYKVYFADRNNSNNTLDDIAQVCLSQEFVVRRSRCCYDTEKPKDCPLGKRSVYDFDITECSPICKGDNFCRGEKKCCGTSCEMMECVEPRVAALDCLTPPCLTEPSCSVVSCAEGYHCAMKMVCWGRADCHRIPVCVETGKPKDCPLGTRSVYEFNITECSPGCSGDDFCMGEKKCCGTSCEMMECVEPEVAGLDSHLTPDELSCSVVRCAEGYHCVMKMECWERAHCHRIPLCVETDVCLLPADPGLCRARFPMHFYNESTKRCELFDYGGCGGNGNRFLSEETCQKACAKHVCLLPKKVGPCLAALPRYYYDNRTKTCQFFEYGGCDGNGNNFDSEESCQEACAKHECLLPKEVGPCKAALLRYYYDNRTQTCQIFEYGGCEGNGNRFESKASCQQACSEDVCLLPKKVGPCRAGLPRYYYDNRNRTCQFFSYGGCDGNGNNFDSEESCQKACAKDVCSLPKERGRCEGLFPKYFYNNETKRCESFIYGGCEGNGNRFDSKASCQEACRGDVCLLPKKVGPCRAGLPRYYYDNRNRTCQFFSYGGCDGNGNNFDSEESCQKACAKDVCSLPKERGRCEGLFPKYFYNNETKRCESFIYGGCLGNGNRFDSKASCQQACSEDVCLLPKKVGPCRAGLPRYYYDNRNRTCQFFSYGGCDGNGNNFDSEESCQKACAKDVCSLPKERGRCEGLFPKYFYNNETKKCESFIYGGCEGNGNRFDSKASCQQACSGDPCLLPKKVGPCNAIISSYYYDNYTQTCQLFSYGGCDGNGNRFDSEGECKQHCAERVCFLPKDEGILIGIIPPETKYHYCSECEEPGCRAFDFYGPYGNANRFLSEEACQEVCPPRL